MNHLTGLFLGAGASYEAGMPLVWELTRELKAWLTPEKLRQLNHGWRLQGGGHPDNVIEDFASVLQRIDLHYESILGHLDTQFRRHQPNQQDYHGLYSWLAQMVYAILYARHVKNAAFLARHLRLYEGIKTLAEQNKPLWVFSLNHDLIIEVLAATFGIPLHSGFSQRIISLPRRNKSGGSNWRVTCKCTEQGRTDKRLVFLPQSADIRNLPAENPRCIGRVHVQ